MNNVFPTPAWKIWLVQVSWNIIVYIYMEYWFFVSD